MGNKYTLFFAAKEGRVEDLRWVLKHKKLSPNLRDPTSQLTPLHLTCKWGHSKCTELLLEEGANVNARTQDSMTAVHLAVYLGHVDCLRLLIKYQADVHATARFGSTALHQAVYFKRKTCAELLIQNHAPLDAQENFGMTPLAVAIKEHEWSMAKFLIDCGANVDICDYLDCNTPLHLACMSHTLHLVVLLLDAGASTNIRNSKGETPLDCALSYGEKYLPVILVLLEYGATTNAQQVTDMDDDIHNDDGVTDNDAGDHLPIALANLVGSQQGIPRSLKSLCRVAIRRYISRGVLKKSYQRSIPKVLREYVQEFG